MKTFKCNTILVLNQQSFICLLINVLTKKADKHNSLEHLQKKCVIQNKQQCTALYIFRFT